MKRILFFIILPVVALGCQSPAATSDVAAEEPAIVTPVTVVSPSAEAMAEYLELNATSAFLQKSYLKASTNGYITTVNAVMGTPVSAGQRLFTLTTKEARSIGNTINLLDTSFRFSGVISIKAATGGYLAEVNHQPGDYVQEGEQLAMINDAKSFVFILNLPYELRPYVMNQHSVQLSLPDGKIINGTVASAMPVMDSASQTQNVIIKVNEKGLPANLIAKVKIEKRASQQTLSLPRQTILSDETQVNFWVMQVIDSSTAVKVMITKGIETTDRTEILKPAFSLTDRFLLTGNFGLPDTAAIRIVAQ